MVIIMKRKTTLVINAFILVAMLIGGSIIFYRQNRGHIPKQGFVPDKETAVRIATAILDAHYPDSKYKETPVLATYNILGYWHVVGTLPEDTLGGVPEIKIRKSDGRILYMNHGK